MTSSVKDTLLGIERSLWTNDADVYRANLVDGALLVFAETGVLTRDAAVEAIKRENAEGRHWAAVQFDDVWSVGLPTGTVLLTYRVTARWAHSPVDTVALASSVYVEDDGRWKVAFHQQTPLAAAANHDRT
jgi:hypothetical protein